MIYNWYEKPYFKAAYKEKVGYISYSSLVENEKLSVIIQKDLPKMSPYLARLTKKYGASIAKKISNGGYWRGMSKVMALESLGEPNDKNRTTGDWGVHEQWIYNNKKLYLYFENGKLESYQN